MSWNNGGGNGFGPSSSQLGGGFTGDTGAAGFSQTPTKRNFANQTLHPCTIKQLSGIDSPQDGGNVFLDGKELSQVKICGNIRSVEVQSTFTQYEIDDGTGMMIVKHWAAAEEATPLQENTYAMVCGRLSFYNDRCTVTAFSIRSLTDHNELTYHLLETCYAHKLNTSTAQKATTSFQPNFGGGTQNNFGAQNQQNQQNTGFGGGFGGGNNNGGGFGGGGFGGGNNTFDDQMTPLQNQILQITTQYDGGEEGIHIDRIIQAVGSGGNVNDIREAVEWLTNEGQLYSTIDDEHFKSTSE